MDDLLADFVAETREMLEASQGEIIAWEADPSDRSRLDAIFRFFHTVKGNCGFFDFPRLERLSHAAEDVLADLRAERREADVALVSAVLAIIDRISAMADAIEAGEEFPEGGDDELIAALAPAEHETGVPEEQAAPATDSNGSDGGTSRPKPAALATSHTIRLPTELLDRVMSGVSDMVLARNDLAHRLRVAGTEPTIDGPFERLTTILSDVRDAVTRMRMQRVEHLFGIFPRMVRDLSHELGKQVMVDLEGGDVELDREMVEMIRDPLTHIVRNALDHGIETPSERLKVGKREIGLLSIAARQSGNKISIVITDDGRGLDAEKIGAKAIENGLVDRQTLDAMNHEETLQLVFEPGLSTADKVSSVSGRGVGLDVVRENIERVGGSIKVTSTAGVGSLFFLSIPLTLSIISGVTVEIGDQCFAIPQSYIEEIVQFDSESLDHTVVGERGLVTFRGVRVPCLSLAELLEIEHRHDVEDRSAVMIRLANGDLIAFVVDMVNNIGDLVVKPLPPVIMQTELYGGSTQLEDGTPILVLDVPQIALNSGLVSDTRNQSRNNLDPHAAEQQAGIYAMLFIGTDQRRYAMRMETIQRIETLPVDAIDQSGHRKRAVINGKVLPLIGCHTDLPDKGSMRLLRISDGSTELAYAISKVEDAVMIDGELTTAKGEEDVEGIAIVDGAPVPVIDSFRLFAQHGQARGKATGLTCSLPDSEWAKTFLAPIVARCGYVVLDSNAEHAPDIVIKMADDETITDAPGQVITLHDLGEETETSDDSMIYRYDQEALVKALDHASSSLRSTAGDEEAA